MAGGFGFASNNASIQGPLKPVVFSLDTCYICVSTCCNHQSPFSENVLPCFSSVTYTMLGPCAFRGDEFAIAAAVALMRVSEWAECRPLCGGAVRSPPSLNE